MNACDNVRELLGRPAQERVHTKKKRNETHTYIYACMRSHGSAHVLRLVGIDAEVVLREVEAPSFAAARAKRHVVHEGVVIFLGSQTSWGYPASPTEPPRRIKDAIWIRPTRFRLAYARGRREHQGAPKKMTFGTKAPDHRPSRGRLLEASTSPADTCRRIMEHALEAMPT